ncbi:MAG: hypothetical protein Q9219_006368 [cf. Caloplaca sp. 3 TL-2023]
MASFCRPTHRSTHPTDPPQIPPLTSSDIKSEPENEARIKPMFKYPGLKSARKRLRCDEEELFLSDLNTRSGADENHIGKETDDGYDGMPPPPRPIKRPFAPSLRVKKKSIPLKDKVVVKTRLTQNEVDWYYSVNLRQAYKRSDLIALTYTVDLIRKCCEAMRDGHRTEAAFSDLRHRLHQMEFFGFISEVLIVKSKVLEDHGLPGIFDTKAFPWDLRADALMMFLKWCDRRWDPDLLRGIVTKKGITSKEKSVNTRSLDPDYPGRVSPNYVGAGGLVNGQWWPLQICALRDGAHGTIEGGIHGQAKKGAYSIILSGGGYADIDDGPIIKYCGTSGKENQPTGYTERMLESYQLKNPVRVLRSSGLANKHSKYRPIKGIRYDGIYDVTDHELLDPGTAMYRFTLKRCPNQDPIRYQGVEARPTEVELEQFYRNQACLTSSD